MQGKKYYSISEVTEILQIHQHKLRYLENKIPTLIIQKIKNRRYYTKEDIKFLSEVSSSILTEVKILLKKFQELSVNITFLIQ